MFSLNRTLGLSAYNTLARTRAERKIPARPAISAHVNTGKIACLPRASPYRAGQIHGVDLRGTAPGNGQEYSAEQRHDYQKFAQIHRHTPEGINGSSPNVQPHLCACIEISVDPHRTPRSRKGRMSAFYAHV
jgi:hypothetical protein